MDQRLSGKERVESVVPEVSKTGECCAGIDEAGRGPVLGKIP